VEIGREGHSGVSKHHKRNISDWDKIRKCIKLAG
jgi:hypothetical protein